MAKTKRISINSFDKIVQDTYIPTTTVSWNGIDVEIKNTLSFVEMMGFVDSVVKSCFTEDDDAFIPEVKVFAIECNILEKYANFTLPENIEHKYNLLCQSDAVDMVLEHINQKQFNTIIKAIDEKLYNMAQSNVSRIMREMDGLYNQLDDIQNQFSGLLANINPDDIAKMVGAVANGKIDEQKLVQAYADLKKSENQSDE